MIQQDGCVLITIKEFCKLKNISVRSFYDNKLQMKFPRKKIGRFFYISFKKTDIIYIDKDDKLNIHIWYNNYIYIIII